MILSFGFSVSDHSDFHPQTAQGRGKGTIAGERPCPALWPGRVAQAAMERSVGLQPALQTILISRFLNQFGFFERNG
jgi:hypothetical protein